jgi:hypothetical protein
MQRMSPLFALSGHPYLHCECPLSGVKRTRLTAAPPPGGRKTKRTNTTRGPRACLVLLNIQKKSLPHQKKLPLNRHVLKPPDPDCLPNPQNQRIRGHSCGKRRAMISLSHSQFCHGGCPAVGPVEANCFYRTRRCAVNFHDADVVAACALALKGLVFEPAA